MFWLFLLFSAPRTRELHRACFVCFPSLTSAPQSVKLSQPCHFLSWKYCFSCDHMINAFLLDPCYHKDTLVTMRILFHILPQREVSMLLLRKCTHHVLGEALNPSTDIRVIFSDWWLRVYPSAAVYKPSGSSHDLLQCLKWSEVFLSLLLLEVQSLSKPDLLQAGNDVALQCFVS